jgi:biotin transport system substrate-specific component
LIECCEAPKDSSIASISLADQQGLLAFDPVLGEKMKITTRELTVVALFAALTALGAWVRIPIQPVPFTFQVFFALLSGVLLGPFLGALSQLIYLSLGLVGLPVFAGGNHGISALWGPTGGYLFGFVIAAFLIGFLVKRFGLNSLTSIFVCTLGGLAAIYLAGILQLMVVLDVSLYKALVVGFFPFVGFDLVKAALATVVARRLQRFTLS